MSSTDRPHIGQMDRKVTIEQPTESRGSSGGVTSSWSTLATVWARKMDQTAGSEEGTEVGREVAQLKTLFAIRHRAGITEKMRVKYGGDNYYITAIIEIGRKDFLTLKTERRDNE